VEFLYEAIVMGYLARGNRFVCPQFSIKGEKGEADWRCPDFVVLDFDTPQVVVVEVTAREDMPRFVTKVKELYDHGRQRIREELAERARSTIPNIVGWPVEIHLFVREDRKDELEKILGIRKLPCKVFTLEEAFRRWKWESGK
jgi:hypothetical protein